MLGLTLTLAIQAIASMGILTLPVLAPLIGPAVGLSAAYVGYYIGIVYVGAMLGSLASGTFVPRWGAIRVSQVGLVLAAVGLVLSGTGMVGAMALGALLLGVGYGPITPASSHLLARTSSGRNMALIFSLKQTGVPLGGMVAGATAPWLASIIGWQASLYTVALSCLACALASQALRSRFDTDLTPPRPVRARHLLQPVVQVCAQKSMRLLALCSLLFSAVQVSLTTYAVTFLNADLGVSLVTAGFMLSVCQLGGVAGRLAWGYLADRGLGATRTLALLAMIVFVCSLLTTWVPATAPAGALLILLTVFGATAIGWNGVFLAELARRAPPGMAGSVTGGASFVTFFGVVAGPPLFGAVSSYTGSYRIGFTALALPMLWCAFHLIADYRSSRHTEQELP